MKRFLSFFSLWAVAAFAIVACNDVATDTFPEPEPPVVIIEVESVEVAPTTIELAIGEETQLSASVLPADAQYTLEWISTNDDVVTVADGVVKGIASGTAIVMAKAGNKTGSCTVSVVGVPVESITLNYHELELEERGAYTLSATVLPEDADNKSILWSSSNPDIVSVNGAGSVTALRAGQATITAQAGKCTDECVVTVTAAPLSIGDFYYSDGSWSHSLDPTRTPIGVVFYVGDVTASDPVLKAEHPYCTHGLVVALGEQSSIPWQSNYQTFNDTVGRWVELNTDYETITSGYGLSDNLNRIMGYQNTKAIEAFNADEANAEWKVDAVEWVVNYRNEVVAPESSSDWYLGSSKEYSLLMSGDYGNNIWDIGETGTSVQNKKEVNEKIAMIEGATQVGVANPVIMFYWTSTEFTLEFAGGMLPATGRALQMFKGDAEVFYTVRPILAF